MSTRMHAGCARRGRGAERCCAIANGGPARGRPRTPRRRVGACWPEGRLRPAQRRRDVLHAGPTTRLPGRPWKLRQRRRRRARREGHAAARHARPRNAAPVQGEGRTLGVPATSRSRRGRVERFVALSETGLADLRGALRRARRRTSGHPIRPRDRALLLADALRRLSRPGRPRARRNRSRDELESRLPSGAPWTRWTRARGAAP